MSPLVKLVVVCFSALATGLKRPISPQQQRMMLQPPSMLVAVDSLQWPGAGWL